MAELKGLEQEITRIFRDALKLTVPASDVDLIGTGILDSLAFVELVLQLERRFAIRIAMDGVELDHFRTIASITSFVAARRQAA
jgi:acyl carrier protein